MPRMLLLATCLFCAFAARAAVDPATLRVPPGFHVEVFSADVPNAREIAFGSRGTVFVGSNDAGKVYALTDADHDGRAERVRVITSGLELPVGVAFHDGDLYVSAVSRILRLRAIEEHLDDPPAPEVVTDRLPRETHHGWRYLAFGPDGKLYVPIGAPCNVCDRAGYAKLMRMDADGTHWQDVAYGIRNTVGFTWQPGSGRLWFTDNGRDLLGDDLPSDELNRVDRLGAHYGFPYCHQGDTPDPEFGKGHSCKDYVPPAHKFGAHVASLGLAFYTGAQFPAHWRDAPFVAEHGSWNRTVKSGYRVVAVHVDAQGRVHGEEAFLDGFLDHGRTRGRP
ncbi:MAG TPA: PQQ-dependent sugar dehydrogenase, partial [Mizugakiibacter sp.]